MVHVEKQAAPQALVKFVKKFKPSQWSELSSLDSDHAVYDACITSLRAEQHEVSAYTELPLNSGSLHIDHYRRRHLFPQLTFDWNNLLADQHNPNFGADRKDSLLKTRDEYDLLISPVADDPSFFFTYQLNGDIIARPDLSPADRERAEFTIHCFGLQHNSLRERRKAIIQMLLETTHSFDATTLDTIVLSFSSMGFPSVVNYALGVVCTQPQHVKT